jgi:lysophospholipase L1-like esterase
MKKFCTYLFLIPLLLFCTVLTAQNGVIKVVVLGSSTAAGTGPVNSSNAWVNLYRTYLKDLNSSSEVINLAVGGYSTYQCMPSSFTSPSDRPSPVVGHNITTAISLAPDVIIINLPTNDAASGYTLAEQMYNYNVMLDSAAAANIPVYVATTQPRNLSDDLKENLKNMRDSINRYMGDNAIDFWTDLANADGTIATAYDSGDGVHLNDAAHILLASRVEAKDILDYGVDEADYDTINIDLGTTLSTGNWNNLTVNSPGTETLNLITSSGDATGYTAYVHDAFTGVNTAGTASPDVLIDFPATSTSDSFFGSEVAFGGVTEATGGITIAGLSTENAYSFIIFASRAGVTDNRETRYIVSGSTNDTVYLNPSNNTSNVVTVSKMVPSSDGKITITTSPGTNNTNSSKFYFFGAVKMIYTKEIVYDSDGVIKIDFGSAATTTAGNWNNLTSYAGNETISDLINTEGNSTGFSIYVNDAFGGINEYGTSSPDESLGLEATATSDSFFGNTTAFYDVTEPTGALTLTGLDVTTSYTFSFFGSRPGVTDNREALYTVTGSTSGSASLNASNNTSNVATVEGIVPTSDGKIVITVTPGSNNTNSYGFFYLGAMTITYGEQAVYDNDGKINIDLGDATTTTSGWNNLTAYASGSAIDDLVNTSEHNTGITLTVDDAFTGINVAGTTAPNESLGWASTVTSDSFFGNVGSHNGIYEPTAGLTFSSLDPKTKYSFTFFASRDGVSDDREAKYIVTGSTDTTVYLDAANNTANVVQALEIVPSADSTITINIAPGSNNTNSVSYYYLGAIVINYEKIVVKEVYDPDGTISIDCGSSSNTTSGNWNNMTAPTGGQTVELINNEANKTGISAYVHDAFTDVNLTGTTSPDASLNMDATVTSDSFFGNSGAHESIVEATAGITFTGMDTTAYYTFTLFASRDGVTDNREASYTVTGKADTTVYLDAANNTSNVVYAENIQPTSTGIIKIDCAPGPHNTNSLGYYYLGAILIDYDTTKIGGGDATSVSEVSADNPANLLQKVYPNPAKESVTINFNVPKDGKVLVRIFDITGQSVSAPVNKTLFEGNYSTVLNESNCSVFRKPGIYLIQVKVSTRNKTYLSTQKLIIAK